MCGKPALCPESGRSHAERRVGPGGRGNGWPPICPASAHFFEMSVCLAAWKRSQNGIKKHETDGEFLMMDRLRGEEKLKNVWCADVAVLRKSEVLMEHIARCGAAKKSKTCFNVFRKFFTEECVSIWDKPQLAQTHSRICFEFKF